jgi:hypothetical protein
VCVSFLSPLSGSVLAGRHSGASRRFLTASYQLVDRFSSSGGNSRTTKKQGGLYPGHLQWREDDVVICRFCQEGGERQSWSPLRRQIKWKSDLDSSEYEETSESREVVIIRAKRKHNSFINAAKGAEYLSKHSLIKSSLLRLILEHEV